MKRAYLTILCLLFFGIQSQILAFSCQKVSERSYASTNMDEAKDFLLKELEASYFSVKFPTLSRFKNNPLVDNTVLPSLIKSIDSVTNKISILKQELSSIQEAIPESYDSRRKAANNVISQIEKIESGIENIQQHIRLNEDNIV